MTTFKKVTTYVVYGHEYHIFFNKEGWAGDPNNNHYCAFKKEWIDENGCLNRTVTGLDMAISQSVEEIISRINYREELTHIQETEANGDIMEAIKIMASRMAEAKA